MMMLPVYGFEMREHSGSHEQPLPFAENIPRRIKLIDCTTLRAW